MLAHAHALMTNVLSSRKVMAAAGLSILLAVGIAIVNLNGPVTIRLESDISKELSTAWQGLTPNAHWVSAGPCDLRLSAEPPNTPDNVLVPGSELRLPQDLGQYRSEFADPASGALALAATPWVFVSADTQTYGERWSELEAKKIQLSAFAELPAQAHWILPLDARRMKRIWLTLCRPNERPSRAASKLASWFYGVHAQNAVVAARYYSPWSKMVDPQPAPRPWEQLTLIPLVAD